MYVKYFKRLLDISLSLAALMVLALPLALVALAIRCESPGPALFTQTRIGRGKRPFTLYKLRTMRRDAPRDMPAHLLEHPEQYVSGFGAFIRKSGIDELPQLFNILRGDMSIVGPRPALYNQEDLIALRDAVGANDVRPGLTGWAQINGRGALDNPQKAALDGEYVRRMSFLFDCRCALGTILCLLRGGKGQN